MRLRDQPPSRSTRRFEWWFEWRSRDAPIALTNKPGHAAAGASERIEIDDDAVKFPTPAQHFLCKAARAARSA